jgi:hypothetical protein
MNAMTSGTFQAGSSGGGVDSGVCDDAVVAAPIDMASIKESAIFRMCPSFQLVSM